MRSRARLLGHPMHPMLVVFPIVLFPLALVFDLLAWFAGEPGLWRAGFVTVLAGFLLSIAAAVPGVVDFTRVPDGTKAHTTGMWHAGVGVGIAVLYAVAVFVRWPWEAVPPAALATGVDALGTALVVVQGWLGGELVYKHHVGVLGAVEGGEPVAAEDEERRPFGHGAAAEGGRRRYGRGKPPVRR